MYETIEDKFSLDVADNANSCVMRNTAISVGYSVNDNVWYIVRYRVPVCVNYVIKSELSAYKPYGGAYV